MADDSNQNSNAAPMTFEEALGRLEYIVGQLESGALSLEDSLAQFDEGMRLSKICSDKLAEAENKIEMLVKRNDGSMGWVDYNKSQQQ